MLPYYGVALPFLIASSQDSILGGFIKHRTSVSGAILISQVSNSWQNILIYKSDANAALLG